MTTRGVYKPGVSMLTSKMIGVFKDDFRTRMEFFSLLGIPRGEHISSV